MSWKETLARVFPDAMSLPQLLERSEIVLGDRGFTPNNTLFANATCRDEANKRAVEALASYWGENFDLAGLGGYPSAGLTGFAAYSQHVPDGGNLLIFYGSHVGVSQDGQLGTILRPGMARESGSCGALLGFLGKLAQAPRYHPLADSLDFEQFALEEALLPFAANVLSAPTPLLALTERTFEVVDARLHEIIERSRFAGPIAVIGGITLNTPTGEDDWFAPRHAAILNVESQAGRREDLLGALEG